MDNFKTIYRILKSLEANMDYSEIDLNSISHTRLGITRERWEQLMIMLQDSGYISGIKYSQTMSDDKPFICEPIKPRITLRGLEYLSENSTMNKVAAALKGIKEIIPGA